MKCRALRAATFPDLSPGGGTNRTAMFRCAANALVSGATGRHGRARVRGRDQRGGTAGADAAERAAAPVSEAVARAADHAGRQIAAGGADLAELLTRSGYEPKQGPDGCIHLANCPFHELLARHADLVCAMNLHLLQGLIGELGTCAQARLDPAEGRCCVTISLS